MKKTIIAVTTVLMATSSAFGMGSERGSDRDRGRLVSQTEVIRLRGEVFQGENTIRIRRALRDQGVSMEGKAVKSVTVMAKSRQGRGRVRLLVNRESSAPARIAVDTRADRRDERRALRRLFNERGGMNRVTLESPIRARRQLRDGTRRVQLVLSGNIKVARIRVELVSKEEEIRKPVPKKPRERSDAEIIRDLIGGIIGGIIEEEIGRGRP